jgi:hypothetical protein
VSISPRRGILLGFDHNWSLIPTTAGLSTTRRTPTTRSRCSPIRARGAGWPPQAFNARPGKPGVCVGDAALPEWIRSVAPEAVD